MDDISVRVPDRPVVILGAIAAIVPFFGSSVTSSSVTANGRVTEFSYRDNVALACGVIAAVCGLIALLLALKHKGGAARIGAAVVVLALGGIHIARGLGVFAAPAGSSSHVSLDVEATAPPTTIDAPGPCATAPACTDAGKAFKKAGDFVSALPAFERACKLGRGDGCFFAGVIYTDGKAGKADAVKAVGLFDKGCAVDDPDSCDNLGIAYLKGEGIAKDPVKGGCTDLGISYQNGYGDVPPDPAKAIAPLTKTCDQDWADACDELGFVYLKSKNNADHVKAGPLLEKACKLESDDCTDLAVSLANGDGGLKRDLKRAIELYAASCDKGKASACNNLGVIYRNGNGVMKDEAKAKELFHKACDGGLEIGCNNLK